MPGGRAPFFFTLIQCTDVAFIVTEGLNTSSGVYGIPVNTINEIMKKYNEILIPVTFILTRGEVFQLLM